MLSGSYTYNYCIVLRNLYIDPFLHPYVLIPKSGLQHRQNYAFISGPPWLPISQHSTPPYPQINLNPVCVNIQFHLGEMPYYKGKVNIKNFLELSVVKIKATT